jgi:hypothetical protein
MPHTRWICGTAFVLRAGASIHQDVTNLKSTEPRNVVWSLASRPRHGGTRVAFTFYASDPAFYHLEGQRFAAPAAASRAALAVLRQMKSPPHRATPAPELNL